MTFDIVAGVMITAVALSLIIFLTIRNRRIIERIHSKRSKTIPQTKVVGCFRLEQHNINASQISLSIF